MDQMRINPVPNSYYRTQQAAASDGVAAFFRATYAWMASGLGVTAATAWFVANTPSIRQAIFGSMPLLIGLFIAQIAIVFTFSAKVAQVRASTAAAMFLAYSVLMGITLSSVFMIYARGTIYEAFGISALSFAGLAAYGAVTKRDLTPVGSFVMMGFWGLLVAMVVNIFLQSSALAWISSCVGVVVFSGLTAWDNQRLRQMYAYSGGGGNLAINGALRLYLDFINLFMFILRLFSDRR